MKCPFCGRDNTRVVDSRPVDDNTSIRRRRVCDDCRRRFTSYERAEVVPIMVIKKDDTREPFDRGKLTRSIMQACHKRPVTAAQIEGVVSGIEQRMGDSGMREVASSVIGEQVLAELKSLDEVGYVRFASVYREFNDVNTFIEEIRKLSESE